MASDFTQSATTAAFDSTPAADCFHCGLPVPNGSDFTVQFEGETRPLCCKGCEAVAEAIIAGGLSNFYKFRTRPAVAGREVVPAYLRQAESYDHPQAQKSFVRTEDNATREASLILEGIVCAACAWLIERHIAALPGVSRVQINYGNHRARVNWDDARIHLSHIIKAVARIGYRAYPYDPSHHEQILENARKLHLRRLGVAGVMGMQVMILAVALYAGGWSGIEQEFHDFFRILSLILTVPVVLYSGQPFFQSAWRDLKNLQPGMDVPVSLGIAIAFIASAWAAINGTGHVYFDSVVMFVFLLLTARYFEMVARKRATEACGSLVHPVPELATRLAQSGQTHEEEHVSVNELRFGDCVLVRPGETVPIDGHIVDGHSTVDESLLTGESMPLPKTPGQSLLAGSINIESPLTIKAERLGPDTRLAAIVRLLDRAQSEKPPIARMADRVASWFVTAVLVLAAVVASYWWYVDPQQWLPITIAVLVITCPCALSLATPAAITAATGRLTRLGLLVTRGHALERLARTTYFVFDKTGTLTCGRLRLVETQVFSAMDAHTCQRYAISLEQYSEHPIAKALFDACANHRRLPVATPSATPGRGVQGLIGGKRFVLGTPEFVHRQTGLALEGNELARLYEQDCTIVLLASDDIVHAAFLLLDEIRPGARDLIDTLNASGKTVMLMTGDHEQAARYVADRIGIHHVNWDLTPEIKLEQIRMLQKQGQIVAMVGDGVNDAPVLAQADSSIAMGGGTRLAAVAADMILLSEQLPHLASAIEIADKTLKIIRQNMTWAVLYNVIAVPAAALGFVAPWIAVLGMSASSLLVVANALRLVGGGTRQGLVN
jgi:Cu2+-exporting ATPase